MHQKVEDISFSPCENYLVTYRYQVDPAMNPEEAIIVWDIRSGAKLRTFSLKNPLEEKFQVQATIIFEDKQKKDEKKKIQEKVIRGRVKSYNAKTETFSIEEGNVVHDGVRSCAYMKNYIVFRSNYTMKSSGGTRKSYSIAGAQSIEVVCRWQIPRQTGS